MRWISTRTRGLSQKWSDKHRPSNSQLTSMDRGPESFPRNLKDFLTITTVGNVDGGVFITIVSQVRQREGEREREYESPSLVQRSSQV